MSKDWKSFGGPPPLPRVPKVHLDRFGHLIEPGHLVLYHPPQDLVLEVVDVTPVLNPSASGGTAMQTTLQARFKVQALTGIPDGSLIIVGESQERLAAKAASNGSGETTKRQTQRPSGLVLTDAPDTPADPPEPDLPMLACSECGAEATPEAVGLKCESCGCGTYQVIEA